MNVFAISIFLLKYRFGPGGSRAPGPEGSGAPRLKASSADIAGGNVRGFTFLKGRNYGFFLHVFASSIFLLKYRISGGPGLAPPPGPRARPAPLGHEP